MWTEPHPKLYLTLNKIAYCDRGVEEWLHRGVDL